MADIILLRDFLESQIEFWLPIAAYPGYDVSNLGRVRSWRRQIGIKGQRGGTTYGGRRAEPRISKASPKDTGRLALRLCSDGGKTTTVQVHRLVGIAFVPNPFNLPEINHKTGLYTDNRVDNLEWISSQGNQQHATTYGLRPHGERHWRSSLNTEEVLDIRSRGDRGETWVSIARLHNTSRSTVGRIIHRETWIHLPEAVLNISV